MVELLALELALARRQRVNRAELTLECAKEMMDQDGGVGVNIALCSRIRYAQRQVSEAKERLRNIGSQLYA